jgi:transcriptional regulator with XRE-family HTH domain
MRSRYPLKVGPLALLTVSHRTARLIHMQGDQEGVRLTTGERIGWLMGRQGRKAGQVAAATGIDPTSFWRYRRDERPIPHTALSKLADELGTSTDFLACRTDDPRPYPADGPTARKLGRRKRPMRRSTDSLVLLDSG